MVIILLEKTIRAIAMPIWYYINTKIKWRLTQPVINWPVMKTNYYFYLKTIIFSIGIIAFVISFFSSLLFWRYTGVAGWIFINILAHETGHIIGCIINRNQITELSFYWFNYKDEKITPNNCVRYSSYCKFKRTANDSIVFIMGPAFSLITLAMAVILAINSTLVLIDVVVSALFLLMNCSPRPGSDIMMFLSEYRKG